MDKTNIITVYSPLPVPYRNRDWCSYREGNDEYGPYGWGATESEAIHELTDTKIE